MMGRTKKKVEVGFGREESKSVYTNKF